VEVEMVLITQLLYKQRLEQPTQAVAAALDQILYKALQAVQALSFFATPAQFNISLVAQ
jgi:hypothetical protein